MATGRTVKKFTAFLVDDSGGTLRNIKVDSINGVGLTFPEEDLTAFTDAIMGVLSGTPDCQIAITGPLDNTAATGNHIVLNGIAGGVTPLSLDVQVGIQAAWTAGDPQFGITSSAVNGFLCTEYILNPDNMRISAKFRMFPGSIAPAWGVAAET